MVFHFRCFSLLILQEEEYEYERAFHEANLSSTQTYYSAFSDSEQAAQASISNLADDKPSSVRVFTLAELKVSTNNFDEASKMGEGASGSLYSGVIKSLEPPFGDIQVAVKYANGVVKQWTKEEWVAEVNHLSLDEHHNLVELVGYCAEGDETGTQLLLVYRYIPYRSLRDNLSRPYGTSLSWTTRLKVAQDIARIMTDLENYGLQIALGDFRSSNIVLGDQWNARFSNFGFHQVDPQQVVTYLSINVLQTAGYEAPEYVKKGHITYKSHVWSYGVFLYELITGRLPFDKNRPKNKQKLVEWVKPYIRSEGFRFMIDPGIEGSYPLESVKKLSSIAQRCLSRKPKSRPKMSEVLEMVNQLITGVPSQATNPALQRFKNVFMCTTKCK